jgi:hypothetical protein
MNQSTTEPTVCAILLTADRPALARRAVECFRRQTYRRKCLFVLDTTKGAGNRPLLTDALRGEFTACAHLMIPLTIGELRNEANRTARTVFESDILQPDILIHWDDDDWSHQHRIAEQVALLQSSGADCVGYNQMLFWREDPNGMDALSEAWLYSNPNPGYALGTSLCYWRKTWERKPFPATSYGEDLQFCIGLKCVGVKTWAEDSDIREPRMIARIHGGNTSTAYDPAKMARNSEWKRVPEWDEHCRRTLET